MTETPIDWLEVDVAHRLGDFALEARFTCPAEGFIALVGGPGAGKTVLLNLLAGLLRPERGRIVLGGQTLFDAQRGLHLAPERRRLSCLFREDRLFPHLSVRDNLLYGHRRTPAGERRVELDQVVSLLALEPLLPRRPGSLSGAERQRAALGRALLASPRLLLMDEPLAALDPADREAFVALVAAAKRALALPVFYAGPCLAEVARVADSLVLLAEGRIAAAGPLEALAVRPDLRTLTGGDEAGAIVTATVAGQDKMFGLTELRFAGGRLRVPHLNLPLGQALRLQIPARRVGVALTPPENTSFLNVIPCVVKGMGEDKGPEVDLQLDAGGILLWARITARSRAALKLAVGQQVYALVKQVIPA